MQRENGEYSFDHGRKFLRYEHEKQYASFSLSSVKFSVQRGSLRSCAQEGQIPRDLGHTVCKGDILGCRGTGGRRWPALGAEKVWKFLSLYPMFTNPLLQSSHTGSTSIVLSIREILFSVLCLDSLAMLSCPCAAAQRPPQKRHCHGQLSIEHSATASSPHSSLFFNRGLESMAFMKVPMFLPVSFEA